VSRALALTDKTSIPPEVARAAHTTHTLFICRSEAPNVSFDTNL
jgi:hypothetical protein